MERPDVKWDGMVGLEETWKMLLEVVQFPIKFPQLFTGERKHRSSSESLTFGYKKNKYES